MSNMIMNTIYNQYLTTYAPQKSDTRYDTHKRSELKSIYNSMTKVNRDAPLYKFDNSEATRQSIIGIKEEARQFHNNVVSIMGDEGNLDFSGKVAYSTNENIVSAKYIGTGETFLPAPEDMTEEESVGENGVTSLDAKEPAFDIEVLSLASPQVNLGKYLPKEGMQLPASNYSFDVSVNGQGYEFQFAIREGDTNFDVQNRLSRLINNSGIHLTSSVEEDENGNAALKVSSAQVGIHYGQSSQVFSISDNDSASPAGVVDYFGINYVAREASNAHIKVNGMEASSASNTFILEKQYEVSLNGISPNEGETVTIGIKPDTEALVDHMSGLIGSYNKFIEAVTNYQNTQSNSMNLVHEMNGIAGVYKEAMERLGITLNEEGTLALDKDKLNQSIVDGDAKDNLGSIKDFSSAMIRKSNQVSLNPVSYINKTVVAYKNPGKTFIAPYTASAYAGMLFNSYC